MYKNKIPRILNVDISAKMRFIITTNLENKINGVC